MMSTFLAQQTSQKLFLDFLLGIHKVLPKTLGDLLRDLFMCIARSLPNNFSFMFFNIFLNLKINKKNKLLV